MVVLGAPLSLLGALSKPLQLVQLYARLTTLNINILRPFPKKDNNSLVCIDVNGLQEFLYKT